MISAPCTPLVTPDASNRRPRIAVTISTELLDAINALAERKQWSTSKAAEYLLERGVKSETSSDNPTQDLTKLQKLLEEARKLGF